MVKNTAQRQAIKKVLEGNTSHPTAKDVYEMVSSHLPYITKPTVYNILHSMVENGELQVLTVDEGSLRFDPNTKPHAHLFCTNCRKVFDVDVKIPESFIKEVKSKYFVSAFEPNFRGLCPSCKNKNNTKEERK